MKLRILATRLKHINTVLKENERLRLHNELRVMHNQVRSDLGYTKTVSTLGVIMAFITALYVSSDEKPTSNAKP